MFSFLLDMDTRSLYDLKCPKGDVLSVSQGNILNYSNGAPLMPYIDGKGA